MTLADVLIGSAIATRQTGIVIDGPTPVAGSSVVILTQRFDVTADFVVQRLAEHDVEVVRFDLRDFPKLLNISAEIDNEALEWSGAFARPTRSITLGDVRSIWWRRPTWFDFPDGLTVEERRFARDEASMALGGLLRVQNAFWMNHPEKGLAAEYKPVQLRAARRVGLDVPRTLLTNDPADARRFVQENNKAGRLTVYKTLAYPDVVNPVSGDDEVVYTSVVTESDLDDDLIGVTACLFQEMVPKDIELRVMVVRGRTFTAGIDASATADGRVDFRSSYGDIVYRQAELPAEVERRLVRFVDELGLSFGAADLIRTPDGEYVFLEINPGGQWMWLEVELGLPISAAIAEALAAGAGGSAPA